MKNILLPTDFSENSIQAIHYAMAFYKNDACTFFLLNVQKASSFISDDLMAMQPSATLFESLIQSATIKIESLISDLKKTYANALHHFNSKVDYDNFIDAINQIVKIERIDMIVMGTTGASKLEKQLFGSNTIRVIQRGNCPVLAVPKHYEFKPINTIAFTSNYVTNYKSEDLQPLIKIAKEHPCKIQVLHVDEAKALTTDQENNKAFLDANFAGINHAFVELKAANVFDGISNYISEHSVDLLVMMSKKHSFLERLFVRHTVEDFAFDLKIPLLVMENTGDFDIK